MNSGSSTAAATSNPLLRAASREQDMLRSVSEARIAAIAQQQQEQASEAHWGSTSGLLPLCNQALALATIIGSAIDGWRQQPPQRRHGVLGRALRLGRGIVRHRPAAGQGQGAVQHAQ